MNFLQTYQGKRVLITGHTGFKGSWLAIWLHKLGAKVIGLALDPKGGKDNFVLSKIGTKITDIRGDIRNLDFLKSVFLAEKPEIVFHLAAQPIVFEGYKDPVTTYQTNILGTVNVLEAIRLNDFVKVAVFITTDKVYKNEEWIWPYREVDKLGGFDPYSSSKAASELVIESYRNSFFSSQIGKNINKAIASARAGNVIGGGDWAENRIVPDCIRALAKNETIEVRNPKAIRPWQHVLEPLAGYLMLGEKLLLEPELFSEAWNFGPDPENIVNVETLVKAILVANSHGDWKDTSNAKSYHEASLLSLDINKSRFILGWNPVFSFAETVSLTMDWYKNYQNLDVMQICLDQIAFYEKSLRERYENS